MSERLIYVLVHGTFPDTEVKGYATQESAMRAAMDILNKEWGPLDAPEWIDSDDDLLQWANEEHLVAIDVVPVHVNELPLEVK